MRRLIIVLLVLALLTGTMSGCVQSIDNSGYIPTGDALLMEGEEPAEEDNLDQEQELVLAYYPTRSLNPLFGSDYTNRVIMSLMYQGLFAVDSSKNVTPILCGGYRVSANNQTWVFYLDSSATFSDGTRVTVEDVVASYNRAMENDYYINRFLHVTEVSATEDGGVAFYLNTAYGNLPLLLDVPIVKASEVEAELPLGTGPYTFVEGVGGCHLQRVANWWCGDLKIPARDLTIDLVEVSSTAEVRDAFQFGGDQSVSVVCANPMSDSFAEYRCDYELWEIESGYMLYIGCNILYSDFFEDGTLRKFLTYGIDRENLAQDNYNGMVYTVTLPCSPNESFYNRTLASGYGYDSMKFLENLRGYTIPTNDNGVEKTLRILVNTDDSARTRIARSIAATLTDLGLPSETLEYGGTAYRNALHAQNYDIYLGMTRLSANMDLSEFFRPWGEMHWGGLSHESLYGLCQNALQDEGNFYNLYSALAADGRIIPLMFGYYTVYAQRGLIPDLNPSRDNVFYYSLGKTMEGIRRENE